MALSLTIIGGYLGAGKTTLVNHLLRHANGMRLAVLVNEFGQLPIDEDLIEAEGDDIISIAGGCVCCSYGNDLTLALMDMAALDPPPDHVVLEASGVAMPGAIAAAVSLLQSYTLDGIITLCSAETVMDQTADTYIADTIERQIKDADLIVLNKSDLVDADQLTKIEDHLRAVSGRAQVVTAKHGVLPMAALLQNFDSRGAADQPSPLQHNHAFQTSSFQITAPVDADALARGLASADIALIRAKGFVQDIGGTKKTIQIVGRRWEVTSAADDAQTAIVIIGRTNDIDDTAIRDLITAVSAPAP